MRVTNLTSDSDYFIVDKNFASLAYTGDSIIYTFTVYGKLLQALIDGNDEVKIQLVKKTRPSIKYFIGTTKEDIEVSNLGFVQSAKKQLQESITNALLKEKTVEIINILPDDKVSGVGSGTINEDNYREFLPEIEQITTYNRTSRRASVDDTDLLDFAQLTRKIFNDTGIYPGRVADVNFPGQRLTLDSDGLNSGTNTAQVKRLLENNMFREYYTKYFVKDTNSKIRQRFTRAKAEYQKFEVNLEIPIESTPTALED